MEAATLSSPQRRPFVVNPIQKSLSLPSYAKAGGEGIDHKLIFAALEQKEKIRRKSKIFTKEKRQNIFCLPIPSSARCRETSFSSDTSCSSLEYQKPQVSKPKKESNCQQLPSEFTLIGTSEIEPKTNPTTGFQQDLAVTAPERAKDVKNTLNQLAQTLENETSGLKLNSTTAVRYELSRNSPNGIAHDAIRGSLRVLEPRRGLSDAFRTGVGSSDSMERSSRSSSDSLSRKERMVALKARVEAQREKYGEGSSEEEEEPRTGLRITRYNSDGVIHRTVREVKSKSSRLEKRIRRRSQDEWAIKRTSRKQNMSLYIPPGEENMRDLPVNEVTEVKTDFCPSPQFPDLLKKNYFSDFPSREDNVSRFVQARIKSIEDEEMKRRTGMDKSKKPINQGSDQRNQSLVSLQNSDSLNTQKKWDSVNSDLAKSASPSPKASHAPTPPPRSPKSLTFVNKAFIQHQNTSYLRQENRSLERKHLFQPSIRSAGSCIPNGHEEPDPMTDAMEKRKIRELINSRRRTCGNFDFAENNVLDNLKTCSGNYETTKNSSLELESQLNEALNGRTNENKGYFSSSETFGGRDATTEEAKGKLFKNKWEEMEQKREMQFNSLESKRRAIVPSWMKWRGLPQRHETCICSGISGDTLNCFCVPKGHGLTKKPYDYSTRLERLEMFKGGTSFPVHPYPSHRLSKSEANIAAAFQPKSSTQVSKVGDLLASLRGPEKFPPRELNHCDKDEHSATANLESAMEELQNVYLSLKFSSDNLSEKNSLSNASDEDSKNNQKTQEHKHDLVGNTLLNACDKPIETKTAIEHISNVPKSNDAKRLESSIAPNRSSVSSGVKSPVSETLCIDELFNDLTRQLDFEQKLLKESRDHRIQSQPASELRSKLVDHEPESHSSPLESIVSIRKELYNNLYKCGENKIFNQQKKTEDNPALETFQTDLARKKYKAVRSLSANISYLMNSDNVNQSNSSAIKNAREPAGVNTAQIESHLNNSIQKSSVTVNSVNAFERERVEPKGGTSFKCPQVPEKLPITDQIRNQKANEIRQIRVSMDTSLPKPKFVSKPPDNSSYSRLTSAVSRPRTKPQLPKPCEMDPFNEVTKASTIDVLDEVTLENLLKSLLNDIPEKQQSNHFASREVTAGPTTPPVASGKFENVMRKRSYSPAMMELCIASKAKSNSSEVEAPCNDSHNDSRESAQKVNYTRQNNNAHIKTSFIPVYSKKSDVCHNLPRDRKEIESKIDPPELPTSQMRNVLSTLSPPYKQKNLGDSNEKLMTRTRSHMRRHSVGFEDIYSATYCFGHNFTNDKRFQTFAHNPNSSPASTVVHGDLRPAQKEPNAIKPTQGNHEDLTPINQNSKLTLSSNENEKLLVENEKPLLQRFEKLKDKSFKRKSSLNRMDFIHMPASPLANTSLNMDKCDCEQKNSSSDVNDESRVLQKPVLSLSKRKHSSSPIASQSLWERKVNEVTLENEGAMNSMRSKIFPKINPLKLRNRKINHCNSPHFEKLSYSAGELESLSSEKASSNKVCLSAQEFDNREHHRSANLICNTKNTDNPLKSCTQTSRRMGALNDTSKDCSSVAKNCDIASQSCVETTDCHHLIVSHDACEQNYTEQHKDTLFNQYENILSDCEKENLSAEALSHERSAICSNNKATMEDGSNIEGSKTSNLVSQSEADIENNTSKIQCLEISSSGFDNLMDGNLELEDDEPLESDTEKRPNSILKKFFEGKKELHGILKPTPDEKLSKTPPSILKHRESSEEKDIWQQNDLHSILKKSTSEDESYNSSSDIRPILKNVSTDDESSGGTLKPRPILKKRTSFSDECSYACFASGELKPILKKKSLCNAEEQPKPILKTRRKSEDGRSTMEFVTGARPRAYSADMGVKSNHEAKFNDDSLNFKTNDLTNQKCDRHDL